MSPSGTSKLAYELSDIEKANGNLDRSSSSQSSRSERTHYGTILPEERDGWAAGDTVQAAGENVANLEAVASRDDADNMSKKESHPSDTSDGKNGGKDDVPYPREIPPLVDQPQKDAGRQNMVSWSGPDDLENPKNWSNNRKWAAVIVVSSFTFISPVSSSMVAPALGDMAQDLGVTGQVESQMLLSIFVLAYAIGPLILGPLSEVYGRVPVLQLANLFFLIFNLVCGFARNTGEMLAFRFLAGLGGSAPLAVGGGVLADCFTPEQRGKAIGIYSLAPLIGPAV